jgi:diacylglycerol kinase family enzyme
VTVAVLVNAHARHGSDALGARIRRILPQARVAVTRSLDEARDFLREELAERPPSILLSGGGDGTAVSLLNTLRDEQLAIPALGLLPLGTGNGWARATGSVGPRAALRSLSALENGATPAVRPFGLVEVEGRVTPFAGMGWDAEILADYKRMVDESSAPVDPNAPPGARSGQKRGSAMLPYLRSMFTRSIPRLLSTERPRVRLVNLGEDALVVDPSGRAVPVEGGGQGAVLYEGPLSVCGAGTTEQLGLGFRAFRFAHLVPGKLAVRVYAGNTFEATMRMPLIWGGSHPLRNDHHFLLSHCRFELDRPVPVEIGGDVVGERTELELSLAPETISLVDWRRSKRDNR